jgi:hypothetical protein
MNFMGLLVGAKDPAGIVNLIAKFDPITPPGAFTTPPKMSGPREGEGAL